MSVCIYHSPHTVQVHFIFFIQCFLIFLFYPSLGHDFLHVCKIISYMLAEVLQKVAMQTAGAQNVGK